MAEGRASGDTSEGWAPALWKAALVLGGAVVGLVLVPDRLVAYLSLHVPPRTRDALVTLWAVVAFVALSRVFVLVQRGRRG